jgi:ATP-dependent RNA helicase DeaD
LSDPFATTLRNQRFSISASTQSARVPAARTFRDFELRNATHVALAKMNIEEPTPIQTAALPPLLAGEDVIGQARTGSGKTLAFAIPALERIDTRKRAVQVLVLTPTRELAVQVGGVFEDLAAGSGARVVLVYGGRG